MRYVPIFNTRTAAATPLPKMKPLIWKAFLTSTTAFDLGPWREGDQIAVHWRCTIMTLEHTSLTTGRNDQAGKNAQPVRTAGIENHMQGLHRLME